MEENVIQTNGGITINIDASVENIIYVILEDYIWNHATWSWKNKNGKYLGSIMDVPVITCNEIIDAVYKLSRTVKKLKQFQQNLMKKSNL